MIGIIHLVSGIKKFCEIKGENLVKSRNFSEWVFLDIVEKNLKDVIEKNTEKIRNSKIVFFGITEVTNVAINILSQKGISTYAVIDNNTSRRKMLMENVSVYKPQELLQPYDENILIFIGTPYFDEMSKQVEKLGYNRESHIIRFFNPQEMIKQYGLYNLKEVTEEESKKIQIDVLDYIKEICEKNGLRYYLAYGTLLGAVRHRGFIPWDDDIDIYMPIKDIYLLYNILQNDPKYEMAMPAKSEGYFYFYPRIIDKRTVLNIVDFPLLIKSGISIDIFPLVALGDELEQAKEKMDCAIEEQRHIKNMISTRKTPKEIQDRIEQFWTKQLDDQYLSKKYCGNIFGPYGDREILESYIFKKCISLRFEEKSFNGPGEYDLYLKSIYGNYMEYPPEDKRVSSHIWVGYWI